MPLVRYNLASTLDGFIASPDHTTSWIVSDPTIDFPALHAQFSTFVMGRRTYEAMLQYDNPLAGRAKEEVLVVSTTMKEEEFPEVTIVRDPKGVVERVRELKGGEGKDVWVMGGAELVGLLMGEGLVDVVEVAVMPVLIGEGIPMVGGLGKGKEMGERGCRLKLEGVEALEGSGILMTRYRVLY